MENMRCAVASQSKQETWNVHKQDLFDIFDDMKQDATKIGLYE